MSIGTHVKYQYSRLNNILLLLLCAISTSAHSHYSNASESGSPANISYRLHNESNRTLIFSNNPEYLWSSRDICDLADEPRNSNGPECRSTLFRIDSINKGNYRAWWEHRNMMPFVIQSGLVFENREKEAAFIEVAGIHVETNSKKNGGREFAALFNSHSEARKVLKLEHGERIILQDEKNKRIFPGHYFAGVSDFSILSGRVSFSEVVFRKNIATELRHSIYEQRNNFGVRESLVYKGVSTISSVELTGAVFTIDDETPAGPLPIAYNTAEVIPDKGYCLPGQSPVCTGSAIGKSSQLSEFSSWVTHIAPDPADTNPKRARAILDDLITLVLPASLENCPSAWPLPQFVTENQCLVMSSKHRWYLPDAQNWRLPNWGNWAVLYRHPMTLTNTGSRARVVKLVITTDGESPIAFKGSGTSDKWIQFFLTNRSSDRSREALTLAQAVIAPSTTQTLEAEFILAGPAAGTLQHHIEISN